MERRGLAVQIASWERSLAQDDRTPYAGVIRLGWKETDEKGRTRLHAADHFIVPEHLVAALGEKPTELEVIFLSNDLDKVVTSSWRRYGKTQGLICYGGGGLAWPLAIAAKEYGLKETRQGYVDSNGELRAMRRGQKPRVEIPCLEDACPFAVAKSCRPVMTLRFALSCRPLTEIYAIFSTSYVNFSNVLKTLELAQDLLAAVGKTDKAGRGDITGLPMRLRLRMRDAHPQIEDGDGPSVISTRVPELWLDSGLDRPKLLEIAERPRAFLSLSVAVPVPAPEEEPKPEDLFFDEPVDVQTEAFGGESAETPQAPVEEKSEEAPAPNAEAGTVARPADPEMEAAAKPAPEVTEQAGPEVADRPAEGEREAKLGEPYEATVDLVAPFERRVVKGVRRLVAAARGPEGESLTLLGKVGFKELEHVLQGLPADAVVRIRGRRAKQFVEVEEAELVGEPADEWGASLEEFFA